MGNPTGFLEHTREKPEYRKPYERVGDFDEFRLGEDDALRRRQGGRCMDCGVPFCQSSYGCPVDNLIPEWNDLVYRGRWEEAFYRLLRTNNFPEFTGRVCPAPCETACVLGINQPAVTIKDNECAIIDRAYRDGLMIPRPPKRRTGKRVAVVGSGPSGLAAADQLNHAGHEVTVYEKADRAGGLLMYGIPNMKLDKTLVRRRVDLMAAEGVSFVTNTEIGRDVDPHELVESFDAVLLSIGAGVPRDLPVPGRDAEGVHFAMDFLSGATTHLLGGDGAFIDARGKDVVVIGGGDTGNDCIGTSMRQGCGSLVNFELLPQPPEARTDEFPWPTYPRVLKTDYGHEEAADRFGADPRQWSILTKEFLHDGGRLTGIKTVRVSWKKAPGERPAMQEIAGSEETWKADLVFLALGFLGPERTILDALHLGTDPRGNVAAEYGRFATSVPGVFAAGDARRGQSLVVWAIKEGRLAARAIDIHLMGRSALPE